MLFSSTGGSVLVASAEGSTTFTVADESFIPTRSFYPYYISVNSSCTSKLVKDLWARLLYEERNFNTLPNKGSYTSWSNEYYTSDANYIGIGGTSVNWKGKVFSTDTGDFDAFLGNSLEANPEMFGQFLGLPGYENSDYVKGYDTFRNIFQEKLSKPEIYKNFSKSIVALTKDGKYLDGSSASVSYNGETFSYWILCALAYYYEGDGSETYLSNTQAQWLENQAPNLVNRYVSSGATAFNGSKWVASGNSLAGKYEPVYNLCARSSAGVNNASKNKEFFNYVVASGHGAGAFLNKHNSINIAGLSDIDDMVSLFNLSDGWCGGLCASGSGCSSHTGACNAITKASCKPVNQGGKATAKDVICVQLHKNSTAEGFLLSNESIKNAYGTDASKSETWQYRHRVKHMGLTGSQVPTDKVAVDAVRATNSIPDPDSSRQGNYCPNGYHEGNHRNTAITPRKSGTMTKDYGYHIEKRVEEMGESGPGGQEWYSLRCASITDLNTVFSGTNSPQKVTITYWYNSCYPNDNRTQADYIGELTTWSASSSKIQLIGGALGWVNQDENTDYYGTGGNPPLYVGDENPRDYYMSYESSDHSELYYKSYTFDISRLTADELKNGYIHVIAQGHIHGTDGGQEDGAVGPYHIATVEDKIDSCDIYGHDWQTTRDLIDWSDDYKTATITYYCNNNKKEDPKIYHATSTAVKSADGKRITYTVTGYKGETFTKVDSSSADEAGVTGTLTLNKSNVSGNNTDESWSNSIVKPGGDKSSRCYKLASSYIKFSIKEGYIPAGTQKIQFSFYGGEEIFDLNIMIYSGSNGKIIGMGGKTMPQTYNESAGLITIPLISNSNEELADAYVVVTGKAHTQNWTSVSSTPSTAHSSIGVTQMKLYF
ncbi:MAG: hypothetical protein K6B41_08110 [Butyrivibrio sp.]|nr:hypothetical protein [Butyrivibrio sp.]